MTPNLKITASVLGSFSIASALAQPDAARTAKPEQQRMNVLFLISDDMRAELNVYGSVVARTPNLDRLAQQGVRFEHAYCQYPLSGPARTSLLTGRRPTTSGVYGNGNREFFGATYPDWVSLPKYFKQHGYASLRSGKVFHGGIDDTEAWTEGGEQRRWSTPVSTGAPSYVSEEEILARYSRTLPKTTGAGSVDPNHHSDRWEAVEGDAVKGLGDTRVADRAIEYIRRSRESGEPFFIACGFSKPHSPLIAPREFFDLYPVETIPLPPDFASLPSVPVGFPAGSIRMNNADLFINRSASPEEARAMKRAYLACVSYVDWNVGRVIAELERQGLRENTIIVFWADHGYQLGEKGKWSKAGSLWEQGARVPLIILDPRAKGNGNASPRIVELLDLYPTLVDLCGLPAYRELEGVSLKPLLNDPYREWNRPAYTVWNEHDRGITGVAVRTEKWRYAEFFGMGAGAFLTDPVNDPDELKNLVYDPKYRDAVAELHKLASAYVAGKTELPAPKK
ncbi:MAG: sulfatase [Bacteroidales bacterium]|jgi:arylsulfatase A-like enzyme|nr:sulfatase [Bacteroidales bacterium]